LNKYRAKKTQVGDLIFDSQKEARRWSELLLLQRAREITNLERQVKCSVDVEGIHICNWFADFVYTDLQTGQKVYEDTKSAITRKLPVYRLKKKLVKAVLKIDILES
jgi:hypothetical protein